MGNSLSSLNLVHVNDSWLEVDYKKVLSDIHDIVQCVTSVMLELLFDTVYNYKHLRGLKFSLPSRIGAGA